MKVGALKYLSPVVFYTLNLASFYGTGYVCWMPLVHAFGVIPLLEILIKNTDGNMSTAEEEIAKADKIYDWMLYIIVPLQFLAIYIFLNSFYQANLNWIDTTGHIVAMGLLCGIFGINVGHELGHRTNIWEQRMAKLLLMSSLYVHFFVEHNKGHHKNVATNEDPATSRLNEPVYFFYVRSMVYSYLSAWQIANKEMKKKGLAVFSWQNEMIQTQVLQLLFVLVIGLTFGLKICLYFIISAFIGALLLETVNYIEHYGLQRKRTESGNYERTLPQHSWNSNNILGRVFLFELSRHSDHHYMASRKFQILRTYDNVPTLPTGYPGSMLLSLLPPLWFKIMNKRIENLSA
jgi:alkane 1-monooxygenase